jgi:hypothetical protein
MNLLPSNTLADVADATSSQPTPPVGVQAVPTVSVQPSAAVSPVPFPLGFLLEKASAPIQYRAVKEVGGLSLAGIANADALPLTFRPAVMLALSQATDGTWNNAMLAIPPQRSDDMRGVGTISAFTRLLEYGWDKDSPPLLRARRILFRLLAEDEDPAFLFEFAQKNKMEAEQVGNARHILREAAAAALAHAGYEADPRLRGAAQRILDRTLSFINGPAARKPWIRSGNKQVLPPEVHPPSFHTLVMLAHMPQFRSEHHAGIDRLYHYIAQPLPRQESAQLIGTRVIAQPQYVLGDMLPHKNAVDADVPWALVWLEVMARLGYLKRNDNWVRLYDRFLDDMDDSGVWHPHKGMAAPRSSNPLVWPYFPLEQSVSGEERWTDVTFRVGLIGHLAGRPVELL